MADKQVKEYKLPVSTASRSGGVSVFSIEGRFKNQRARLSPEFTDVDRAWRAQWLKDQVLSPNEPRVVPELFTELNNPIRRFYRKPGDVFYKKMTPIIGENLAFGIRHFTTKFTMVMIVVCSGVYYMKYNKSDWTKAYFWKRWENNPPILPGDVGYPTASRTKSEPWEYYDQGFKDRKVFRN